MLFFIIIQLKFTLVCTSCAAQSDVLLYILEVILLIR